MSKLSGKVAIVTGASKGIGAGIASGTAAYHSFTPLCAWHASLLLAAVV